MGGEAAISGTRDAGDRGERAAAEFLERRGCEILAAQWRCRYGELDLVARDRDGAVRKQERLRKTAMAYLVESGMEDAPARFDVAEVYMGRDGSLRVEYLEDAFT